MINEKDIQTDENGNHTTLINRIKIEDKISEKSFRMLIDGQKKNDPSVRLTIVFAAGLNGSIWNGISSIDMSRSVCGIKYVENKMDIDPLDSSMYRYKSV